MQRNSVLYEQYKSQPSPSIVDKEPISELRASIDPRFNNLLIRAASYQERVKQQQQVTPYDRAYSSSVITNKSNAWLPLETSNNEKSTDPQK